MTILGILATLLVAVVLLVIGLVLKKKWLMLISIIPFVISLGQIVFLLLIYLELISL